MFSGVGFLIVLISAFLMPAIGQQRDQKNKKPPKTPPALNREAEELRLNAVSLLHSLAQNVNEIENVTERVRVMAEIGDAFWLVDHEHGREMLVRAFKEIEKLTTAPGSNPEGLATQKRVLRHLVLSRVAKHEPQLANQLIHDLPNEVSTADEKAMQQQGVPTPNAEALLALAENLLSSDPKRATAIAAYSLSDGLSQRLRLFLMRLRAKDSAAADALVAAAIREASAHHPGRLFDVLVLWDYAYQPQDFYFNGIVLNRNSEPSPNASPDLKRSVLAFAVTAIVENLQQLSVDAETTQDRNLARSHLASLYSVIQQLLPSMQVDWPRGSADLQQALVRIEQELRGRGQSLPSRPPRDEAESDAKSIDSLIEKAAAAPQGDARDNLYLAASFKLLQLRQYERGKDVAARIDDPERRGMILEPLDFRLSGEFVEKNRLQEALNIATQLKTPELRISALARIGRAFIEAGESQSGLQTLNTAQSAASKADPSIEVCAATLRVAAAYAKGDPIRTTEIIRFAIQLLNKVNHDEAQWVLMASPGADDALSFSWKIAPGGGLKSVKAVYPRNGGLAALLSRQEFNEAVSIAKAVNKKALSLALQAAVCRAALESNKSNTMTAASN